MTIQQSDAIVLRMTPWSETSLIGSIYTREFGKVSVIAKGARRPKSPFEAALDLLSVCRVVFIDKSAESLCVLTEAKLAKRFRIPGGQLLRLYCAYYLVELLEKLTDQHLPQPELFDLASDTIRRLENPDEEIRAAVLRFELQILRLTGHMPSFRLCAHCGNEVQASHGWLTFGPLSCGVLCESCSQGSRQLMRIPVAVRDYVEGLSNNAWQSMNLNSYVESHRATIRAMMNRTFSCMLDQRLKLHPYLEELGR
ncbi:MAG: DNA repair protein RecO [Pirellulales bacterium]